MKSPSAYVLLDVTRTDWRPLAASDPLYVVSTLSTAEVFVAEVRLSHVAAARSMYLDYTLAGLLGRGLICRSRTEQIHWLGQCQ